jgi:hypothetical protein
VTGPQAPKLGRVPERRIVAGRRPAAAVTGPLAVAAVALAAVSLAAVSLTGCAKMSAALGQQWLVVLFKPNTTVSTARLVTSACSHVPNLRLAPVRPASGDPGMIESARYNATNASDANMAELQQCLQRFHSVQGFNLIQPGES